MSAAAVGRQDPHEQHIRDSLVGGDCRDGLTIAGSSELDKEWLRCIARR